MKFEIYRSLGTQMWFWRLRAANGKIIADGAESYSSKSKAYRAVRRLNGIIRDADEVLPIEEEKA